MNLSVLTTTDAAAGGNMSSMLIMLLVYGAIIAAMYFIFFRPQNKKKKKEAEMRKNAQVGDEITTIGGICGRIIAVKDETDSVIIETGSDRAKDCASSVGRSAASIPSTRKMRKFHSV